MALAATGLLTHAAAQAQGDKTIGILVGFPPGGSLDTVARLLDEKMKDELKAPIVVENKPGAGGRVAADMLKSAPADGTVLMVTPVVMPVLAPLVFSTLNDNFATDFAPVGHPASFTFAFTVPTALPGGGGGMADQTRLEQASTARWAPVVKATGFRAD